MLHTTQLTAQYQFTQQSTTHYKAFRTLRIETNIKWRSQDEEYE